MSSDSRTFVSIEADLLSPEDRRRLERILDFDRGEEYPHDHPPGDCRPIDGPMTVEEHERQPRGLKG